MHEFTHLLQAIGKSTLPKDAYDLSHVHYVSFASFDKFNDDEIKSLCGAAWQNNIGEKEAILVGNYVRDNIDLNI